ncbi:MAG: class B sortase [Provencibacterium sp.]|jgi:sortase B|nr:class B sortase [Provencibacterium sp.]
MNRPCKRIAAAVFCCLMLLPMAACVGRNQGSSDSESEQQVSSWENPPVTERPESDFQPEIPEAADQLQTAISQNSDTVGWLIVPGTEINEAVVQTTDNEYYYRRDALKNSSFAGCLWMDYESSIGDGEAENFSRNTIIYGHNLGRPQGVRDDANGEKFAQLFKFDDLEFAKEHPYFYFVTTKGTHIYEIFTVFYSEDKLSPVPYHYASYSDKDYEALLNDVRTRSQFDYNVSVDKEDKIITLSTCTYKYGTYSQNPHQRFVVMGRLANGDKNFYETADLQVNPDPKAPSFPR